jgi:ferric-dicitrate binding protein FerR (iron transport regulator)
MSDAWDRRELFTLFGQSVDGTLSPADHARFEAILAESADARQLWFQYSDLETGLADWSAVQQQQPSSTLLPISRTAPASGTKRRVYGRLLAASAVLLAAVGVAYWSQTAIEDPAQGVAVLTRSANAEWINADEYRSVGAILPPGAIRLVKGAVQLDFYSGARVILEGPAEARLVSAMEVELIAGRINAHVPPQADGFTINAPDFSVIDRGTEFGLVVAGDSAEVHVFKGKVEITSTAAPSSARVLVDGHAALRTPQGWSELASDQAAFLSEQRIAEQEALGARAQSEKWRAASGRLSEDRAALAHYWFDERPTAGGDLMNRVPSSSEKTAGRLVGCEWTTGRWPSSRAVQFGGEGDRIRFRVEPSLQAVTLLSWVRVSHLRPGLNSLLCADGEATGSLHWELSHTGQLRLGIARDLGRKRADWEAVDSAPFITRERLGQWLFLATTFDGTTVKHYGNGELIGSGAAFRPSAILIGSADIGNWQGKNVRYLPGAIDELAILSRALTDEEIHELFEKGKP